MKIFLDKRVCEDKELSSYGIAAYCAIKTLISEHSIQICINKRSLEYKLTNSIRNTKRFTDNLNAGVQELISAGYVDLADKNGNAYVIDCSKLLIKENQPFIIVTYEEILKIFKIKKSNKFNLLRYFIALIGSIKYSYGFFDCSGNSKNGLIGNMSIDYIANLAGVSPIIAIEYNRLLEEEGLIYISRQGYSYNQKLGSPYRSRNIYGRAEDKEHIEEYAQKRKNSKNKLENGEINNIKSN